MVHPCSRVHPAGRTEASAPTSAYHFAGCACKICGHILPGGVEPRPYGNGGRFYGFALVRSDLPVRTAQSFRHGFAVPPPFTQGRLWRGANAAVRLKPSVSGRGKPRSYVTTKFIIPPALPEYPARSRSAAHRIFRNLPPRPRRRGRIPCRSRRFCRRRCRCTPGRR